MPGTGLQLGGETFGEIAGAVSLDDITGALAGLAAAESAEQGA